MSFVAKTFLNFNTTDERISSYLVGCLTAVSVLVLSGCGGSSSSPPPEPPVEPVDVSLVAGGSSIAEGSDDVVTLDVRLAESVDRTITATLVFAGTAQLNADYEVSATQVSIPAGQQSAEVTLSPLLDWVEESTESIEVRLGTLTGSANAVNPNMVSMTISDESSQRSYDKSSGLGTLLWMSPNIDLGYSELTIEGRTWNLGKVTLEDVQFSLSYRAGRDDSYENLDIGDATLPSLRSGGFYEVSFIVDLQDLEPDESYTYRLRVSGTSTTGFSYSRTRSIGFALDSDRRVVARCNSPGRMDTPGAVDPLFDEQWNLRNTGQFAFANEPAVTGEDLGMSQVLESGTPTGADVRVAVSDTGLEICHPDLETNVEPDMSYNFYDTEPSDESWLVSSDPFLFENEGDHGTSVAGVIGSVANNGIGGRGVAPATKLRGYNVLATQCCFDASLGGSTTSPDSTDVDIFNMSWGTFGTFQYSVTDADFLVHKTGAETLRDGKGAIYVKSAGNTFGLCIGLRHVSNSEVGCVSSVSDNRNNVPYLIVVGAFSADGERSSYSSPGSNLWIAAPSGEFGVSEPATITTDQFGFDKGYDYLRSRGVTNHPSVNPFGDYISSFNGTSAAAPNVSGSVALILDAYPDLSWREVKHALAKNARQIHADVDSYEVVIGGEKVTLRNAWVTNDAGYNFHNWYGFGAVAIDATLEFLEQYTVGSLGDFAQTEWRELANVQAIPDHNGAGMTQPISVNVGSNNRNIEAVQVEVNVTHAFPAELTVQLISPSGTESILIPVYNNTLAGDDFIELRMLTNAFYGESPNGTWRLKLVDVGEGDVGQLNSWRIRFFHGQHSD